MKQLLLLKLFLLVFLTGFSQIIKTVETDGDFTKRSIETFGENGILEVSRSRDDRKGQYDWKFNCYDKSLTPVRSELISMSARRLEHIYKSEHHFISLFVANNIIKVVTIDIRTWKLSEFEINPPSKIRIYQYTDACKKGDYLYLGANLHGAPYILVVNWKTGEMISAQPLGIDDIKPTRLSIMELFPVKNGEQEIAVYLKGPKLDYLMILDRPKSSPVTYEIGEKIYRLYHPSITKIKENSYLLYGNLGIYYIDKTLPLGLLTVKIENNRVEFNKLIRYSQLKSFYSFVDSRYRDRIIKRNAEREYGPKPSNTWSEQEYFIRTNKLIISEDEYSLVGEAYVRISALSKYTHVYVITIDTTGELKWDKSYESVYFVPSVEEVNNLVVDTNTDKSIRLQFFNHNKIEEFVMRDQGEFGKKTSQSIVSILNEENSRSGSKITFGNDHIKEMVEYWYDNYVLFYNDSYVPKKKDKYVIYKVKL